MIKKKNTILFTGHPSDSLSFIDQSFLNFEHIFQFMINHSCNISGSNDVHYEMDHTILKKIILLSWRIEESSLKLLIMWCLAGQLFVNFRV